MKHIKRTKRPRWALLAAALVAGLGIAATQQPAQAYSSADCSGLPRWNSDKSYKKGDFVWYPNGPSNADKHQCIIDKCHSVFNNSEPGAFSKAWKFIASCKSRPSG
jgi:hypothetical protein